MWHIHGICHSKTYIRITTSLLLPKIVSSWFPLAYFSINIFKKRYLLFSNISQSILVKTLSSYFLQVRDVLDNLKTLQNGQQQQHQQQLMLIKRTSEKEVQTDFPVALLENYVVNNRKRILKLLGFTNATTNAIPSKDR